MRFEVLAAHYLVCAPGAAMRVGLGFVYRYVCNEHVKSKCRHLLAFSSMAFVRSHHCAYLWHYKSNETVAALSHGLVRGRPGIEWDAPARLQGNEYVGDRTEEAVIAV